MEISTSLHIGKWVRIALCVLLFLFGEPLFAQQHKAYTIRDGKMYIEVSKMIRETELDSFITQFDLSDLPIKFFLKTGLPDSLRRLGWHVDINNETGFVISKALGASEDIFNPAIKMNIANGPGFRPLFPAVNNGIILGANRFKNKKAFAASDSIVRFFIRNQRDADRVMLAGSFNNWSPDALSMRKTDSGWIADVKLAPGKYWYKFIVDGRWMQDGDNQLQENDGLGNINSVYFRPNVVFSLEGFTDAKNVYLAGSFNNWKTKDLALMRTETGWQLPVYLAGGTHVYKFIVDGKWYADPRNEERVNDGAGGLNSVLRIGKPHNFILNGFTDAKKVMVAGSFNGWRDFELAMKKTATGWELPYVIGPGNYEYKFIVDGKWISDPDGAVPAGKDGNSFLVIEPNYKFRLKGFADARSVYIAGDFNNWQPRQLAMQKGEDGWVFPIHLSAGKVRYKFIVDGKWVLDPNNKLWEQNEYGTGNSIIWVE